MDNYKQLYEKTNEEYKEFYPLTDILSIIDKESGKNLKQLLNQYNHIKLDWKGNTVDTRNSVPLILRHKGLFVTYDNGTSIVTEFYKGEDISVSINSIWQNDNNWTDLSPGTSLADNEDIAEIDGKLKFADRNHNVAQFTGMGRVILRKNLVDVGGGQVKNVLTQDMINKSNTIYEIRYDFDLNGEEITISEGCVLDFQGGSLNNGIIVGNNTIISSKNKIFYNISFLGIFLYNEVIADWFNNLNDAIQFASLKGGVVKLSSTNYLINNTLNIPSTISLIGTQTEAWSETYKGTRITYVGDNENPVIKVNGESGNFTRNVSIQNIKVVGNGKNIGISFTSGVHYSSIKNVTIHNCIIGISLNHVWHIILDQVSVYGGNIGFQTSGSIGITSTSFRNCLAYNSNIGFELNSTMVYSTMFACGTDGCKSALIDNGDFRGVSIINFGFEGATDVGIKINNPYSSCTIIGPTMGTASKSDFITYIDIVSCMAITIIDAYVPSALNPSNGNIIKVAENYSNNVTLINCELLGNNTGLEYSTIIRGKNTFIPNISSYEVSNATQKQTLYVLGSGKIILKTDNNERQLNGTPIFNTNKLKIGDIVQVVNIDEKYQFNIRTERHTAGTGIIKSIDDGLPTIELKSNEVATFIKMSNGKLLFKNKM